ncbi:MAG TPA: DUF3823 domain-containing protein [Puia sp.]|nr:DUF3823 domain-containing protein [Puia sp.]
MRRIIYFLVIAGFLAASCTKTDTYVEPHETLNGVLQDKNGNPYISEEPNGFKIRLIEQGAVTPREFWGMADGKFNNTKIFKSVYKIVPSDGAFFPVDTVVHEISGVTTINFLITPFLTVDATFTLDDTTLKATYRVAQASGAGKIQNARLLVNKWNPNVGMNYSDMSIARDLSAIPDATITQTDYTDQAALQRGVTYYARVAVLSSNTLGKYNFSSVQKIVVP